MVEAIRGVKTSAEAVFNASTTAKRDEKPARLRVFIQQGSIKATNRSHRNWTQYFEVFPATTRQDAWRRSRGVGSKPRTNEVPICRCNDQMAWCPGAAPQLRRTCDPRVRRS